MVGSGWVQNHQHFYTTSLGNGKYSIPILPFIGIASQFLLLQPEATDCSCLLLRILNALLIWLTFSVR